ncbi:MAG: DUF2617 family protein [Planctomycetaceae bacterium]
MSLTFVRPDVSDLVFHLYGRSIHPELLHSYAMAEVRQADFQAVARICDAGHVLTLVYRGRVVTEVATSKHLMLPERKRVLDFRLRGNRDHAYDFDHGVKYHASCQLERLNPDVFSNLHDELLGDCSRVKLAHCFPSDNRLAPGALSLLQTDVSADSLLVHAFHTFPENSAVVKTQSLFEFTEIQPARAD